LQQLRGDLTEFEGAEVLNNAQLSGYFDTFIEWAAEVVRTRGRNAKTAKELMGSRQKLVARIDALRRSEDRYRSTIGELMRTRLNLHEVERSQLDAVLSSARELLDAVYNEDPENFGKGRSLVERLAKNVRADIQEVLAVIHESQR